MQSISDSISSDLKAASPSLVEKDHAGVVYPIQESWDVLLVLDACRYDYMEKIYSEYFPTGNLQKRLSLGTWTLEWAQSAFPDYDDCVYVSANPFIGNSRQFRHKTCLTRFEASKHFFKVFEVWKTGWDNNFGTVRPETVNRAALDAIKDYPGKRLIIHYMQPHYPYLGLDGIGKRRADVALLCGYIRAGLVRSLGNEIGNKLGAKLGPNHEEWIAKKVGIPRLKSAYENNLRLVMTSVTSLLAYLKGKIVITADHGELLGELGKFGHPVRFKKLPEQYEIPWLEVNKSSRVIPELSSTTQSEYLDDEEEHLARKRLKALGYE